MRNPQLHLEQIGSLLNQLSSEGILHGDTAELTLEGVGVYRHPTRDGLSVAFCPTHVVYARVLKEGTAEEHQTPIPSAIHLSNNLRKRIFRNSPPHGFIQLKLWIQSNGVLSIGGHVRKPQPAKRSFPVHNVQSYEDYRTQHLTMK